MKRLLHDATTEAERVIAEAASVAPRQLPANGWDGVMGLAVIRRPSASRMVPAFLLSFALGMGFVLWARPAPVTPAPAAPTAHASAGSRWSVAADEVSLEAGRLSVTRPASFRLRTPHAVIDVTRCRFLAEVVENGTTLWVEEGEALLRSGNTSSVVHAGESLVWPPAPEIPGQLLKLPASESQCSVLAGDALRECLRREARGASLEAQAALYELGNFEAAQGDLDAGLRAWSESLQRFPEGVLHPEVRLARLIVLVKARRFSEARDAALDFEKNCAGDPRLDDVENLAQRLVQPSPRPSPEGRGRQ